MADELDLLRTTDPAPADGPHFADGPLPPHAEQHLTRLLHAADPLPAEGPVSSAGPVPADGRTPAEGPVAVGGGRSGPSSLDQRARRHPGRSLRRRRPGRPVRVGWGLAATVVVVAVALNVLLGGSGTVPAVAAPRPLAVRAHSTAVPLAQVAELARVAAGDGSPGLRQGTHVQTWSLGMSDDGPPITLPEERVVRWRADGSHTEVVVATDPSHPGRPVLTDGGLAEDGKVLSRHTFPPMWGDAPPLATPPHDPGKLRTYLSGLINSSTLTTDELLDATRELLDNWTLGARETAALAALLADAEGLHPAGQVTDRLGRTGQAYVHQGTAGARRMLILDPGTGAVLGLETTFTRDDPEYGVRAGDVMEYSAWLR
ncbi:CU044_5270 family protein [Streptomyces sp. NPDC006655]|uniref:CU044_5270 family protein n=1 Tax=Streptomyces sp. NPDC006655 TaxID=3156898 RepID=UPI003455F5DE